MHTTRTTTTAAGQLPSSACTPAPTTIHPSRHAAPSLQYVAPIGPAPQPALDGTAVLAAAAMAARATDLGQRTTPAGPAPRPASTTSHVHTYDGLATCPGCGSRQCATLRAARTGGPAATCQAQPQVDAGGLLHGQASRLPTTHAAYRAAYQLAIAQAVHAAGVACHRAGSRAPTTAQVQAVLRRQLGDDLNTATLLAQLYPGQAQLHGLRPVAQPAPGRPGDRTTRWVLSPHGAALLLQARDLPPVAGGSPDAPACRACGGDGYGTQPGPCPACGGTGRDPGTGLGSGPVPPACSTCGEQLPHHRPDCAGLASGAAAVQLQALAGATDQPDLPARAAPTWLPAQRTGSGHVPYLPTRTPVPAWLRPGWDGTHAHARDAWQRLCDLLAGQAGSSDEYGCQVGQAVALYHLGAGHETAWGLALQGRPVAVLEMAGGPSNSSPWWAVAQGCGERAAAMLQRVATDASDLDLDLGRLAAGLPA